MSYARQIRIEFNHCDPAGIVFYPRYFEMTNSVVENLFREVIGWPFDAMMAAREGVPTARVEVDFRAPSFLGEVLDWEATVLRIGGSSVALHLVARCGGRDRVLAGVTLVHVGGDGRPKPWPDTVRAKLEAV
jgi:4-hydroxybenzoyl-CoA thioesterase